MLIVYRNIGTLTVAGLAKVAIFTTNIDAENHTLINHKCVCGELNRHFCQTRVMRSYLFFV
jgi:NADPH-dependent 7-cyano-7-deazaguanine reductase QueF-like protein